MVLLNRPVGYDPAEPADEWDPAKGLLRGAVWGVTAAALLTAALLPPAFLVPHLLLAWIPRGGLAIAMACVLAAIVQRASGMMSWVGDALALGLTTLILLSHHVLFAIFGVPTTLGVWGEWWIFPAGLLLEVIDAQGGLLRGWQWFHPYALGLLNAPPVLLAAAVYKMLHGRD